MSPAVAAWTDGRGMDLVLDLVGGPYVAASIGASALKGRIMLIGTVAGGQTTIDVGRILAKRLTIRGTVLRSRSLAEKIAVTQAFERDVVPRIQDGTVRCPVDMIFPLERIAGAHRRMESNESFGKVVITV